MRAHTDSPDEAQHHGRLPWLAPNDLDPEQRRLYDSIVAGPRASGPRPTSLTDARGRLHGPFNALLLDPVVGEAVQGLGSVLRYSTKLEDRTREIAILVTAAAGRSNYEWHIHSALARAAGLHEGQLASILVGEMPSSLSETEALVWRVTRDLVTVGDLGEELFDEARATIGLTLLMDLVILVGYYELLSRSIRVWRTPLPDGAEAVFAEGQS
jgi:alkylhydroperoxidase family enzyme